MADHSQKRLDTAGRRSLAVWLDCDPRTIEKVLRGEWVRGAVGYRIRDALREAGVEIPESAEVMT